MKRNILFFISACLVHGGVAFSQNSKIDSLKKALLTAKEDTQKVNMLTALCKKLISSSPNEALPCAQQALDLAQKLHWKKGMGDAEHCMGYYYFSIGDYHNTLVHWLRTLELRKELNDKKKISGALGNIGIVYQGLGDYSRALEYFFNAERTYEELGMKEDIAINLENMALLYQVQAAAMETGRSAEADSLFRKALDLDLRALTIEEELGNKDSKANVMNNIGIVYHGRDDFATALLYYFKALEIVRNTGNKQLEGNVLGNIGNAYSDIARARAQKGSIKKELPDSLSENVLAGPELFSRALAYSLKALKISKEIEDNFRTVINLSNIGVLYMSMHRFPEAEKNLTSAIGLADSIGSLASKSQCEKWLSHLYDSTGNYLLAFEHYKKYIAARDSISNDENIKKQTRTEMQFNFDKKQAADSVKVAEEKKVVAAELKSEQNQRYSLYGGLALVLLFAGAMYNRFRVTQKQKAVIEEQKLIVEEQKQMVEEKNKDILDSIYYARRIQRALLPSEKYFEKNLRGKN